MESKFIKVPFKDSYILWHKRTAKVYLKANKVAVVSLAKIHTDNPALANEIRMAVGAWARKHESVTGVSGK